MNDPTGLPLGDLLLTVEKPSRYTGGEVNAPRRIPPADAFNFLLAFPDTYEVGMSHLGLQILYSLLNAMPGVHCERTFAPWPDMEAVLRRRRLPLCSLETQRPLRAFDVVGFSLQYELSYTNVLSMLELGGIPLSREARGDADPLIIAGGPCAFNPAPMSPFIDAYVIGEGEEAVGEIVAALRPLQQRHARREERLEALAALPGLYVPSVHREGQRIVKRILTDLDGWRGPACPIVPLMKTIHDRVTLEIARGCTRGCRFCQAGMVWRPVRERSPAVLEEMAEAMLRATGHSELSLLSLSSGDYSLIEPLLTTLMERYYAQRVALALPSLRVETLTAKLIEAIRRVRKTSFTLAPEAGTQRLRDVINKGNTEAELLTTTERIFGAGWKAVKLYFMLGLPGEREEDREGIAEMAYQVLRTAKNRGQVTVSLSTFVPKPHTPFQWQRQINLEETAAAQAFFRQRLRNRNIAVKWHDARMSLLEGILSRSGEETAPLIEAAFRLGCRFDGWSDRFRFDLWETAMQQRGIIPEAFLRERPPVEALPWSSIDCGLAPGFLEREAQRAERGETTPDCRRGACQQCGVCDHRHVRVVTTPMDAPVGILPAATSPVQASAAPERGIRIRFSKLGPARFLSHLELTGALIRALTLGGVVFAYSQGFHPHPKIAFAGAAAVGMESLAEFADLKVLALPGPAAHVAAQVNARLPEGIAVTGLCELPQRAFSLAELIEGFDYELTLPGCSGISAWKALADRCETFLEAERFELTRERDGRPVTRDIRPLVLALSPTPAEGLIRLGVRFGTEGTVRPTEILTDVLGLEPEQVHRVRILKRGVRLAGFATGEAEKIFLPEGL